MVEAEVSNPACVQSMIAINWPLLILTDSSEFPRKLAIAGMVKMCKNEAKVINKGLMEIGETCIQKTCPIQKNFLAIQTQSFLSRGEFDAFWLLVIIKSPCFMCV